MELNHLKYFYEVARLGSFTKAAKALRISQPSVSKVVKLLEERQNVKLLDRTKRGGVYLTPTGKRFFASCSSIFEEIETLRTVIDLEKEECFGDLSIGASDNLCNYLLPEAIAPFLKRYPKIRLKLFSGTSDSIKAELLSSNSELGLFYTVVCDPGFQVEPLGFTGFVIVCAATKSSKISLEDLRDIPYVGSRLTDYSKPYPALEMLRSLGVKPASMIETNSQETQKRLALKGYGYTVVPKFMVQAEINDGRLKVIKTSKQIGSHLYLVKRKNRTLTKPAFLFEAHLRSLHGKQL